MVNACIINDENINIRITSIQRNSKRKKTMEMERQAKIKNEWTNWSISYRFATMRECSTLLGTRPRQWVNIFVMLAACDMGVWRVQTHTHTFDPLLTIGTHVICGQVLWRIRRSRAFDSNATIKTRLLDEMKNCMFGNCLSPMHRVTFGRNAVALLLLPRVLIKHQPIFAYIRLGEHSFEASIYCELRFFRRTAQSSITMGPVDMHTSWHDKPHMSGILPVATKCSIHIRDAVEFKCLGAKVCTRDVLTLSPSATEETI